MTTVWTTEKQKKRDRGKHARREEEGGDSPNKANSGNLKRV